MKLDKHIAYELLTDDRLAATIIGQSHETSLKPDGINLDKGRAAATFAFLSRREQKAYYITETVIDKLELLKVKKSVMGKIREQDSDVILDEVLTFDWSVFYHLSNRKVTFILPDNKVVRLVINDNILWFCVIGKDEKYVGWTFFYVDKKKNTISQNWKHTDVQNCEEFIYKVLCFFYLSENEEQIVEPGHKYGTKKSGKLVNSMPVPVTIVTSKWNITSIRTEGFPVSGHLRLQPTKTGIRMVLINPYEKHGYVRKAKSENEL